MYNIGNKTIGMTNGLLEVIFVSPFNIKQISCTILLN